ncbi:MAG TPA: hypothetical protein VEA79_08220 [Phenylobacterium sp.]|nr:hypothetical protein [Phenylobacterium sp.]
MTLGAMRVLATLQAAVETETQFGGRTRTWSDVADLWVELTVRGAAEPAEGGLRPVFTEDAVAVSHDEPLAEQGQILLAGGDSWRVVRVVRAAPKMGRMTLHLDRVT